MKPIAAGVACLLLSAVTYAQSSLYEQSSEVNNLMVQYNADAGVLQRFYAVPNSPERRDRLTALQDDYLRQLGQLDFAKLPVGTQVDYLLFRRDLQSRRTLLQQEASEYKALEGLFPFAGRIYTIEQSRRRGATPDAAKMAADFDQLGKAVEQRINALPKDTAFTPAHSRRATSIAKGLQSALKSTFDFYNGYDPQTSWWLPLPYRRLDSLLGRYAGILEEKGKYDRSQRDDGSGIIGQPIGREELIRQLQAEMIPYTPEELIAIANKEFAWCDAEMLKASREMGFGNDWKAAMEKIKNTYVAPGRQPQEMMRLYDESVGFLKKHALLTIPPLAEETWRMSMMTPERQRIAPFFLGGEEFLISFPTNTMSHDDKMMSLRGNNPHFSRAVVHHELIAGHGLQMFMNNRYKAYRNFDTPFWMEGWALYWERLLWDLGFAETPEDRIGMLFWRMHRCARIIFSLSYHTHQWTPQQCIDFLVNRVNHERANAEGEVRRSFTGGYGPLYQIAYMIGGLQFEALKKELVNSKKMTYRAFHDAVLHENSMPVEMLRAILLKQPLNKDFKSSWRFYPL
ncbi:DUF885 family protein [Chitinophaga lutea]